MTEVLLEQLNDSDIKWIKQNSSPQTVEAGEFLIQQNHHVDSIYIVVSGDLVATVARNQNSALGKVFAALEDEEQLQQEIAQFQEGEILGEMSFLDLSASGVSIQAKKASVVLAIDIGDLRHQLRQDMEFAARFYRALSLLLLERFERLLQVYLKKKMGQIPPLQDVPVIFGELSDTEVDWMLRQGTTQIVEKNAIIIEAGRQIEYLYVILQGLLSVSMSETKPNRLSKIFASLESSSEGEKDLGREIAKVTRGEIIGETIALGSRTASVSIKALEESIVLAIPKGQLLLKLQQDFGMAARFYRVVALLVSGRLQGLISRLGFGRDSYSLGQSLAEDVRYEDEIDMEMMDNITLGGARFDWMLKRLKITQKT